MSEVATTAKPALILASASPRRRELLELLGIPFDIARPDIDESRRAGEPALDFVTRVAREKGESVARRHRNAVVLSADTIVVVGEKVLGKPRDENDAVRMLTSLSGREHSVYTAVSTLRAGSGKQCGGFRETRVWFRALRTEWIRDYIRREEVLDKAGAYAIQGFASVFISRIEGDYTNVIGLPLGLTWDLLGEHGLAGE